jgi:hypothetical protein
MNRLGKRVTVLESHNTGRMMRRVFKIIYDPEATELPYDSFVSAEKERLGFTDNDFMVIRRVVSPQAAGAHNGGGR